VLGDSAHSTGDARAALADQGHTAVIKPGPLRSVVADGFTIDDFTVDDGQQRSEPAYAEFQTVRHGR
jgi:hypothetical protein